MSADPGDFVTAVLVNTVAEHTGVLIAAEHVGAAVDADARDDVAGACVVREQVRVAIRVARADRGATLALWRAAVPVGERDGRARTKRDRQSGGKTYENQ
jgi:hypothetical protein